jgi:signal transduction histidine kinase
MPSERRSRAAAARWGDDSELISIIAHELKTPVSSLQLAIQTMVRAYDRGRASPELLRQVMKTVEKQGRRLTRDVDNLLDSTRIARGTLELELSEVDLAAVVLDAAAGARERLAQADCVLTVQAETPVKGLWDLQRLEQVVDQLLSNAIEHAAGSPVEITVGDIEDLALLSVVDRGPGIPSELLARLFEPFVRARSSRSGPGLGLGLYIVRGIVGMLGGSVEIASEEGAGATVTVTLPKAGPAKKKHTRRTHAGD